MPLQTGNPAFDLAPAAPQPTLVPGASVSAGVQDQLQDTADFNEGLHQQLLGLVNYKKAKELGFADDAIMQEAGRRLQEQKGLFEGQLDPVKGLASGFSYQQLTAENERRMRAAGKATIGEAEEPGVLKRGFGALKDFFVPPDPNEQGVGDTAGQLLTAPFRLNTRFSKAAGEGTAEAVGRYSPGGGDVAPYVGAALGTAADMGTDVLNYSPRAAAEAAPAGMAAMQALEQSAPLAKAPMGRLGELLGTEIPGPVGRGLDSLAAQTAKGGVFSLYDPREIAAQGQDLAQLGAAGARGVQRLWEGNAGAGIGHTQNEILDQAAAVQKNRQLEPQTIDDLNAYTVREQLAANVSEAAGRVSNDFRPAFWDDLKAARKDPANTPEGVKAMGQARTEIQPQQDLPGVMPNKTMEETGAPAVKLQLEDPRPDLAPGKLPKRMVVDPDPGTTKALARQQALKQQAAGQLEVDAVDADQAMTELLHDPQMSHGQAAVALDLQEHIPFPSFGYPVPREVPEVKLPSAREFWLEGKPTGVGGYLAAKAGNALAPAEYVAKFSGRVAWGVFKRFFADPSAVLPKFAYETGRAYELMSHTRDLFLKHAGAAMRPLAKDERLAVAAMLDSRPEEWAGHGALAGMLQGPQREKILASYRDLRKMLNKLAEVEGLEAHQRVTDYFPRISADGNLGKDTKGIAVPDLGIYAKATMNRFHIPREGMRSYSYDLADVLNVRISTGLRKAYLNPVVTAFEPRFLELPEGAKSYADLYVRRLQGRPGPVHEWLDENIRSITQSTFKLDGLTRGQVWITMMYYRGLLGGALDTAFKNLGQVQNTIGEVGLKRTAQGIAGILSGRGRAVLEKAGVGKDYERIVEASGNIHSSFWAAADKALFMPMKFSEYINRGVAFHGGLLKAYDQGLTGQQALNYAKHVVDKTQFRYGVTNTSPYLQNPLGKLFYQFGSYPIKELQFMEEAIKNKDMRVRMLALYGFAYGASKATGSTIDQAFGLEPWAVPLTGNKRTGRKPLTVDLPTAMATHFINYTAPAPKLAADAGLAFKDLQKGEYTGRGVKDFAKQAAGLVPASRYGIKLYNIYKALDQGYEKGKAGVQMYGAGDAAQDALGLRGK